MKKYPLILLVFSVLFVACESNIKVACIGDSITNGGGKSEAAFFPVQLDQILGQDYEVLNCGESGATMQTDGDKPYWKQKDLYNVFVYQPDIVVIMLGTNDSKTQNWNASSFERDYQIMIDTLQSMKSSPEILLCTPPPAYSSAWNISDSIITTELIPIVKNLAKKNGLEVIDVYNSMTNMSDLFPDGIHPDDEGKKIMATAISKGILE